MPFKRITIRMPAQSIARLKKEAEKLNVTVSDVLRSHISDNEVKPLGRFPRLPNRSYTPADPALVREVAKIGNNLNQLARWANTYKSAADAVHLLTQLGAIERELKKLIPAPDRPPRRGKT